MNDGCPVCGGPLDKTKETATIQGFQCWAFVAKCINPECGHSFLPLREEARLDRQVIESFAADRDRLMNLIRRAIDSWGDYSPSPQSNAGKVLAEMRALTHENKGHE